MVEAAPPRFKRRLVGQPLLYAISIFASLGVFLVSEYPRIITPFDQRYLLKFGYDQGCVFFIG
jgi:hypothetical protein